jgi:hypothetical protein
MPVGVPLVFCRVHGGDDKREAQNQGGDRADDNAHRYFASTTRVLTTTGYAPLFTTSIGAPAGTDILATEVNGNRCLAMLISPSPLRLWRNAAERRVGLLVWRKGEIANDELEVRIFVRLEDGPRQKLARRIAPEGICWSWAFGRGRRWLGKQAAAFWREFGLLGRSYADRCCDPGDRSDT